MHWAALVSTIVAGQALAQPEAELPRERGVTFEAGLGYSDNPARAPASNELEESMRLFRIEAGLSRETERLQASVRSDLQFVDYQRNRFDDETLGGLDVLLSYDLVPRIVNWVFIETYGQQVVDPFQTVGPTNRENINFLTTGPRFTMPLGSRNFMTIGGDFSDVRYEFSDLDNERTGGQVFVGRELTPLRKLSVGISRDDVEYENMSLPNSEFSFENAFFRFESATSRGSVVFDVGQSRLVLPDREDDQPLVSIAVTRELARALEVTFQIGEGFSDAGQSFRQQQGSDINFGRSQDVVGTGDPFRNKYLYADVSADRRWGEFYANVGAVKEDYDTQTQLNRKFSSVAFGARLNFSQRWTSQLEIEFLQREFIELSRQDDDYMFEGSIGRRFGPRLVLELEYLRYARDSTALTAEGTENRLTFRVTYALGEQMRRDD